MNARPGDVVRDPKDSARLFRRLADSGYALPAGIAIAGTGVLLAGQLSWVRGNVEQEITASTQRALEEAAIKGATVSVSGRDVTIRGVDGEATSQVQELISGLDGVRDVTIEGDAATAAPSPTETPSATETDAGEGTIDDSSKDADVTAGAAGDTDAEADAEEPRETPADETPSATEPADSGDGGMDNDSAETPSADADATDDDRQAEGTSGLELELQALPPILFDFNVVTPNAQGTAAVDRLAALLLAFPEASITITGHTDSVGSDETNQAIGWARAQAVGQQLVQRGVPEDRFELASAGEGQPVESNDTTEGRAANRRTEVALKED